MVVGLVVKTKGRRLVSLTSEYIYSALCFFGFFLAVRSFWTTMLSRVTLVVDHIGLGRFWASSELARRKKWPEISVCTAFFIARDILRYGYCLTERVIRMLYILVSLSQYPSCKLAEGLAVSLSLSLPWQIRWVIPYSLFFCSYWYICSEPVTAKYTELRGKCWSTLVRIFSQLFCMEQNH